MSAPEENVECIQTDSNIEVPDKTEEQDGPPAKVPRKEQDAPPAKVPRKEQDAPPAKVPRKEQDAPPAKVPRKEQDAPPAKVSRKEQDGPPAKVPRKEQDAPPAKVPRKEQDGPPAKVPRKEQDAPPAKVPRKEEHANVVAAHYNHLEEKGRKERFNSPIFYLRNFNNWVKSVLIQEYIDKVREKDYGKPLKVLDICCGKGGDLSKWQKARVDRAIFADIAEVSVQQCEARYEDLRKRSGRLFSAEFIAADCTKDTLRDKYADPSISFDVVSCQFGLHYSFESLMQARRMLSNISECIRPDGYFFGTIPNAYEIVSRANKSPDNSFGNRVFKIKLLFDPKDGYPLFGAKYDFHLDGVVDCPEFLVNFELLIKLAKEFGLELVYKAQFADFFNEHLPKYKQLLHRIMCFESYPAPPGKDLIGDESEYKHAKTFLESKDSKPDGDRIGTMSLSEWEVTTIYMAFAFKKCKSTWDSNGKPVYQTTKPEEKQSTSK